VQKCRSASTSSNTPAKGHVISYRHNPIFMNCSLDSHGIRSHYFDSYVGCGQLDRSTDTRKVFGTSATAPFFGQATPLWPLLGMNRSPGPRS